MKGTPWRRTTVTSSFLMKYLRINWEIGWGWGLLRPHFILQTSGQIVKDDVNGFSCTSDIWCGANLKERREMNVFYFNTIVLFFYAPYYTSGQFNKCTWINILTTTYISYLCRADCHCSCRWEPFFRLSFSTYELVSAKIYIERSEIGVEIVS